MLLNLFSLYVKYIFLYCCCNFLSFSVPVAPRVSTFSLVPSGSSASLFILASLVLSFFTLHFILGLALVPDIKYQESLCISIEFQGCWIYSLITGSRERGEWERDNERLYAFVLLLTITVDHKICSQALDILLKNLRTIFISNIRYLSL